MHTMLKGLGFSNILQERQGDKLPPTHAEGQQAIDHVWASQNFMAFIKKIGIAPLNYLIESDHRPIILEIDMRELSKVTTKFVPFDKRKLKSTHVKNAEKYSDGVTNQFDCQGVDNRMENFRVMQENGTEKKVINETMDSIDEQMVEIELGEENRLAGYGPYAWSPTLHKSIKKLHKTKNKLTSIKNKDAVMELFAFIMCSLENSHTF